MKHKCSKAVVSWKAVVFKSLLCYIFTIMQCMIYYLSISQNIRKHEYTVENWNTIYIYLLSFFQVVIFQLFIFQKAEIGFRFCHFSSQWCSQIMLCSFISMLISVAVLKKPTCRMTLRPKCVITILSKIYFCARQS